VTGFGAEGAFFLPLIQANTDGVSKRHFPPKNWPLISPRASARLSVLALIGMIRLAISAAVRNSGKSSATVGGDAVVSVIRH
jgi:hypothetical protein